MNRAALLFALDLLRRRRVTPAIDRIPDLDRDARQKASWGDAAHPTFTHVARWHLLLDDPADLARVEALAAAQSVSAPILRGWLERTVDRLARRARAEFLTPTVERLLARVDPAARSWLTALFAADPTIRAEASALERLYAHYRAWSAPPASDRSSLSLPLSPSGVPPAGPPDVPAWRVCFRLEPPETDAVAASPYPWTLRYLLQSTVDPSLLLPASTAWQDPGALPQTAGSGSPQETLLTALGQAAPLFPPVAESLSTPRPEACSLTAAEAHHFLHDVAASLERLGHSILVPRVAAGLSLRARLRPLGPDPDAANPRTRVSLLGRKAVARYDWQIALGGEPLTRDELESLVQLKTPLVRLRGRWVELRPEDLTQADAILDQPPPPGDVSLLDALQLALAPRPTAPDLAGDIDVDVEVNTTGWLSKLVAELRHGETQTEASEPPGFQGQLRPYQKRGVAWLAALRRHGLGACLADDMGLGKTPQLIALLLHQPRAALTGAPQPALVICPTSVVANWRRELDKFAPGLRVLVHHGAGRQKQDFAALAAQHDVVVTSYSLLHRDVDTLAAVEWGDLVLDEAQNVKNAATHVARSARRLPARWRAALTGTPIENRLSDLWSIFQILNPGYLGSREAFQRRFAGRIERAALSAAGSGTPSSSAATRQLKSLVSPFILRRLKTDPTVIQDLPEKVEIKTFCHLTREQATLYEAIVRDALREIDAATGLTRRGRILAALTKLKQICDHPALFLHDESQLHDRSGKLTRLCEMLEEIDAAGERALVFTQYAEMGHLLKRHLETVFDRPILYLHGGTAAAERERLIDRFQAPASSDADETPLAFILSVKAGGTGLNLTRASEVFHFDRWWNPAVENQATDRAFRIGQTQRVQVYKFVCAGTFEEVLDELIARKTGLAASVVPTSSASGESWLTELGTDRLRDLFALRADALAPDVRRK